MPLIHEPFCRSCWWINYRYFAPEKASKAHTIKINILLLLNNKKEVVILMPTFHRFYQKLTTVQCDLIGQFIALWATFQSLWQQLFYPNRPFLFLGNFCKGVNIFHFSSEFIFGQLLETLCNFFLVTLPPSNLLLNTQ